MQLGGIIQNSSSVTNLSYRFQKTADSDPVPISQIQPRFRRVFKRKIVACNHFRNVCSGESSKQLHFAQSILCMICTRNLEFDGEIDCPISHELKTISDNEIWYINRIQQHKYFTSKIMQQMRQEDQFQNSFCFLKKLYIR